MYTPLGFNEIVAEASRVSIIFTFHFGVWVYEGNKDDFLNYSHSDVTKDTAGSKDTTDTASASPSVKKKETMAAVKTVS